MAYDPIPKCPKCRETNVKLVSQKHRWGERTRNTPLTTLSIYLCTCGTGFTHLLKHEFAATAEKSA